MNVGKILCELQVRNFKKERNLFGLCGISREVSSIGASSASSLYSPVGLLTEHLP